MGKMKNVRGDILHPPYKESSFDCVLCISTLEHVGMNSHKVRNPYGAPPWPTEPEWFLKHKEDFETVKEIKRILKNGGKLLLTVPFGKLSNYGSHIQYDATRLKQIAASTSLLITDEAYFEYRFDGWYTSSAEKLSDVLFQTCGAPASTGLACLELRKI